MENRTYIAKAITPNECIIEVRENMLQRNVNYFITQQYLPDRLNNVSITIQGDDIRLIDLVTKRYSMLLDADIMCVRFLKEGISRTPIAKALNGHESNQWGKVYEMIDALPELQFFQDENGIRQAELTHYGLQQTRDIHEVAESAYGKHGTIMKPGKFARMIGCTDMEAEEFSKAYNIAVGNIVDVGYEYIVVSGDDIVKYYDEDNYLPRNSGTLWGSCMNSKSGIIEWYAKNSKNVSLCVLLKNGKVAARAIIWRDVVIEEWGNKPTLRSRDNRIYRGPLVDRQYSWNDDALFVLRDRIQKACLPYKIEGTWGDAPYSIPVLQTDGSIDWKEYHSELLIIYSKVTKIKGSIPYLDSLMYLSDKKVVANKPTDGNLVKCNSTRGGAEPLGEYITAKIGLENGYISKIAYSSSVSRVLFPHGTEAGVMSSGFNMTLTRPHAHSEIYVVRELVQAYTVSLPVVRRGLQLRTQHITVFAYPNQLKYDMEQNKFVLGKIWSEEKKCFAPVEQFLLLAGRYGDLTLKHKPALLKRIVKEELATI